MNADLFEPLDHSEIGVGPSETATPSQVRDPELGGIGNSPGLLREYSPRVGCWTPVLELEIESDDARRHREDREAAARERKRQREEIEERRRRPLSGSRGDFEQTRLFGREELFQ